MKMRIVGKCRGQGERRVVSKKRGNVIKLNNKNTCKRKIQIYAKVQG